MELDRIADYVSRFIGGDVNAFEELYHLTSKRVYFICLNMLGNEQDANDAIAGYIPQCLQKYQQSCRSQELSFMGGEDSYKPLQKYHQEKGSHARG